MKFEEYITMLVNKLNLRLQGETMAFYESENICTVGTNYYNGTFAITFSMVLDKDALIENGINVDKMADLYIENLRLSGTYVTGVQEEKDG